MLRVDKNLTSMKWLKGMVEVELVGCEETTFTIPNIRHLKLLALKW